MAVAVAFLLLSVWLPKSARAGESFLDPTFNGDGKRTSDLSGGFDSVHDLILQPDGKILALGSAAYSKGGTVLARYNSDGSMDSSFGSGGRLNIEFPAPNLPGGASAFALQPDGKIVLVGDTSGDFAITRYHSNGSLDQSFGNGGKTIHSILGQMSEANAVVIQTDGKIVVAGYSYNQFTDRDFALARYHPDGSVDASFDGDGVAITDFSFHFDMVHAIALQPDGKIVAVGEGDGTGSDSSLFALARYKRNGTLDDTFGFDGKLTTYFITRSGYSSAQAVAIQPDGGIVAAGVTKSDGASGAEKDIALARYKRNGRPDDSFGAFGKVTTDFFGAFDSAVDMVLQQNGKIVVAGDITKPPTDTDFGIVRYNRDGSLDTTFYDGGKLTTDFYCGDDSANAIVIQPDGKIVAAGFTSAGEFTTFALARYRAQATSAQPHLLSVRLISSKVAGCRTVTGTVTLSASAPAGGLEVALTESNPAASAPSSVIIPAGETSACFTITTTPVTAVRAGSVVASLDGVTRSATLIVRPVRLQSLKLDSDEVSHPDSTFGTLKLECPAPAGGITVMLESSNPAVASLNTDHIFFREGQRERTFNIRVASVPEPRQVIITATVDDIRKIAVLRVY